MDRRNKVFKTLMQILKLEYTGIFNLCVAVQNKLKMTVLEQSCHEPFFRLPNFIIRYLESCLCLECQKVDNSQTV